MNITLSQVWNRTLSGIPQPTFDKIKFQRINEEWVSFKVWCIVNGKNPNHGASVREYCRLHKEMIA